MGAKERITRVLITAHLRSLERKGFVVSSLDPDEQVRWRDHGKGSTRGPERNECPSRSGLLRLCGGAAPSLERGAVL
jgi:hypothetical protein